MLSALLQGIRSVDKARVAKSGGVAVAISASLTAATFAGAPIPGWAPIVGSLVGVIVYKLLPPKEEQEVDKIVDDVIDVTTSIPQFYSSPSDYPGAPPTNPSPNNLKVEQPPG